MLFVVMLGASTPAPRSKSTMWFSLLPQAWRRLIRNCASSGSAAPRACISTPGLRLMGLRGMCCAGPTCSQLQVIHGCTSSTLAGMNRVVLARLIATCWWSRAVRRRPGSKANCRWPETGSSRIPMPCWMSMTVSRLIRWGTLRAVGRGRTCTHCAVQRLHHSLLTCL